MKSRFILVRLSEFSRRYPIVRGMASYTVIWPTACLLQQKITGKEKLDYMQALRFSIYGGFFVGPTLYAWLKIATYLWPKANLRSAITKALVEQVSYGPAAICCFFFGINLLEVKPVSVCIDEVKNKFYPTWKIGVFVWPVLQTINFVFIPERNRVVYVSFCSLAWTSILSYVKSLETSQLKGGKILLKDPLSTPPPPPPSAPALPSPPSVSTSSTSSSSSTDNKSQSIDKSQNSSKTKTLAVLQ